MIPERGPVHAPELTGAVDWINVGEPPTLTALRGKVVLLDFWTYGCINCLHVIPELQRLGGKYARELVTIGIHSAKFTNERRTENIRRIVARYGVDYPVANDAHLAIWNAYGARAWPSRVLIDPAGYVVGAASGEGHEAAFDAAIAAVIAVFADRGELDRTPVSWLTEGASDATPLRFPGKVLAEAGHDRVFIADSNHHRIVETALDGRVRRTIGNGEPGDRDGGPSTARFHRPQGLAIADGVLYVADTGNHLVRAVDLDAGAVETIAGTGAQAPAGPAGGAARTTPVSSPWDLTWWRSLLFIAVAGTHQLWMLDRRRGLLLPYAGTGLEARVDGSVDECAFAQPSGLVATDAHLLVADSESSSVRSVALPPVNRVTTLSGGDLFDFGDRDGGFADARFQHPLGVAVGPRGAYVADTYNHKIKVLDLETRTVRTLAGDGTPGLLDGPSLSARFDEPGGVSVAGDRLFVADTNNHSIRVVSLTTGCVSTLALDVAG